MSITKTEVSNILETVNDYKKELTTCKRIRPTVPVEKWVEDPYYVGSTGMSVYPYWKKLCIDVFTNKVNEVILSGGLGTGKTFCANLLIIRKLYELSCFKNPQAMFNLVASANIAFFYFLPAKGQAEQTGFGQLLNWIDSIPYFQDHFPRNPRISSQIEFPENIKVFYGSSQSHMVGQNVISGTLDEANFFERNAQKLTKATDISTVQLLYNSLVSRTSSRFKHHGVNHSLNILISSNTTTTSFTETRIKKAEELGLNSKVVCEPVWNIKPRDYYSEEEFTVFIGSDLVEPCIVEDISTLKRVLEVFNTKPELTGNPSSKEITEYCKTLPQFIQDMFSYPPIDFYTQYKDNVLQALQDVSGKSVSPQGKLFANKILYAKAISPRYSHPFTKEIISLDTNSSLTLYDWLRGDWKPRNKNCIRYLHADQSTSHDKTGWASAYVKSWTPDKAGNIRPNVVVELMMSVQPPKAPHQISIAKCRQLPIIMRDTYDLNIGLITTDQFQSSDMRQVLADIGFDTALLSVDKTDEQYLTFINLLYEERIQFYDHPVLKDELFNVIHYRDKHKVDHLPGNSKDLLDSVVGAVWNAITHEQSPTDLGVIKAITANKNNSLTDDIVEELNLMEGYHSLNSETQAELNQQRRGQITFD